MNPIFGRAMGMLRSRAAAPGGTVRIGGPGKGGSTPTAPGGMEGTGTVRLGGPGKGGSGGAAGGGLMDRLRARVARPKAMPMKSPTEMEPDHDESAMRPERPGAGY